MNEWWIGSSTSAQIRSGDVMKQSSVWLTMPSVRVLDRHDAVVRCLRFDFAEYLVDRRDRTRRCEMAELFDGRRFGVGAGRSEIGDRQRLFERETARDDLAKQMRHVVVGQRSGVVAFDPRQNLRFALGPIEHRRLVAGVGGLDLRDLPARTWRARSSAAAVRGRSCRSRRGFHAAGRLSRLCRRPSHSDSATAESVSPLGQGFRFHAPCSASNEAMYSINASTAASGTAL